MTELKAILRSHLRHPSVAAATTLSMGIGVGTATVMFSLMHALLFRPLDVVEPETVFRLSRDPSGVALFSYPEVGAIRRATDGQATIVAHQVNEVVIRWGEEAPTTAWFELVEAGYFETFGLRSSVGGTLSGRAGSPREVVLSHAFWERLGSVESLVGRTVSVNGEPFVVVGVGPEGFRGTLAGLPVELWLPLESHEIVLPRSGSLDVPGDRFLIVSGRLAAGSTVQDVQASARRADLDTPDPEWARQIVVERAGGLLPLLQTILRPVFAFLSIMVGIVVIIASVNVTGLFLARGSERMQELSTRLALGASTRHLLRTAALDGVVLSVPGALAGVLTGVIGMRLVASVPLPAGVPLVLDPRLDVQVGAFALLLTVASTVLAALVPGWVVARRASRSGQILALPNHRTVLVRRFFVGGQVALATLLLGVAALMARGIGQVASIDPGFRVAGVLTLTASADRMGYDAAGLRGVWGEVLRSVRTTPGVREAGAILFAPMGGRADRITVEVPGSSWAPRPVLYNLVTAGALEVLDIPVVRGRPLTDADGRSEGTVPVLVNETLARAAFPEGDAVGRLLEGSGPDEPFSGEVVGVVRDATYRRLAEGPTPHVYLPFGRFPRGDMIVLARPDRPLAEAIPALTERVRALDPDLVVTAGTMAEAIDESTFWSKVIGVGTIVAGLGGLILALVGLFGTVSYEAQRRLREVAIRRALGASDRAARRLLLTGSLRFTAAGIGIGLVGAILVGGLLGALLHGVPPHDPLALGGVAVTLLLAAVGAGLHPAGRALSVQPGALLKED